MAVEKGSDIYDHLFAHVDSTFQSSRAHVRQKHDLAGACKPQELRVHGRFMLEDVETRAADLAVPNETHECRLVDDLTGAIDLGGQAE